MKTLSLSTKKAQSLLASAQRYAGRTLDEVYQSYSCAKSSAYRWCWNKCAEENGYGFHITSYNTFGFSVSWTTAEGVRIETPNNSYLLVWGE